MVLWVVVVVVVVVHSSRSNPPSPELASQQGKQSKRLFNAFPVVVVCLDSGWQLVKLVPLHQLLEVGKKEPKNACPSHSRRYRLYACFLVFRIPKWNRVIRRIPVVVAGGLRCLIGQATPGGQIVPNGHIHSQTIAWSLAISAAVIPSVCSVCLWESWWHVGCPVSR